MYFYSLIIADEKEQQFYLEALILTFIFDQRKELIINSEAIQIAK